MKSKNICPSCKAILAFDRTKITTVKCPKCNYSGNVADFKDIDETEGPNKNKLYKPGKLELLTTDAQWLQEDKKVDLMRGVNTLGRKSPNSTSSIQFPVTDSYMSKNHATIEVIMKADAVFEHRLSDNKSLNHTFHNGDKLEPEDIIILKPDDKIKLGHTVFKFIAE